MKELMKPQQKHKQRENMKPDKVSYIEKGEIYTGRLALIVRSTVRPEFDLAYIDFEKHWKVTLLSNLITHEKTHPRRQA